MGLCEVAHFSLRGFEQWAGGEAAIGGSDAVLAPFQLAGPMELWIQDENLIAGKFNFHDIRFNHDLDAGVLKKVILTDGAVVTVKRARSVSLLHPVELPLPLNPTNNNFASGLLTLAERLRCASGSEAPGLVELSSASKRKSVQADTISTIDLHGGATSLLTPDWFTALWPLAFIDGSYPNLLGFEALLSSVLGPKANTERTKPETVRMHFEVLARVDGDEVVPERVVQVNPVIAAEDTVAPNVLVGNTSMSEAPIVNPPSNPFTLRVPVKYSFLVKLSFDLRDALVGRSVDYEFDVEIDNKVLPFKLLEDVNQWDYVELPIFRLEDSSNGLLERQLLEDQMPVLASFQLAGPMELWIQDENFIAGCQISQPASSSRTSASTKSKGNLCKLVLYPPLISMEEPLPFSQHRIGSPHCGLLPPSMDLTLTCLILRHCYLLFWVPKKTQRFVQAVEGRCVSTDFYEDRFWSREETEMHFEVVARVDGDEVVPERVVQVNPVIAAEDIVAPNVLVGNTSMSKALIVNPPSNPFTLRVPVNNWNNRVHWKFCNSLAEGFENSSIDIEKVISGLPDFRSE
ncbi:Hypothetical predicted protein [Olea europaea subsp. europaea]|uniref:Uncharacterized protein n=1 Tax=Olea europaea subsp. europaea TaxID=158383 RepID=A0A8S0PSY4_OLEEU|nr:Hypothetical predicted protein [Olea europaea subsp. europaea]